jgi:hypothetical protein
MEHCGVRARHLEDEPTYIAKIFAHSLLPEGYATPLPNLKFINLFNSYPLGILHVFDSGFTLQNFFQYQRD